MKVCHVITRMIVGGAQENTFLSALGLHEAGHDVVLLTGPSPGPEGELLSMTGKPPFPVVVCPDLTREISPLRDLRAYRFLLRFFRRERFDVVHTHSSKAGVLGRIAAKAAGVPLVVHTIHGQPFHRNERPWKNALYIALERLCAKRCDRIFAVAQAMIDQSLERGIGRREQFRVVYSGMDMSSFLAAKRDPEKRRALGIPENAVVVATLARLFPLKGYEQLWRIAPELFRREPNLHFLILGDGFLHGALAEQAAKAGFSERVSFAGLVPPQEIPSCLAQADLLVHFSLREGLPRAAVQALATERPVVAYRLDGTPEVVLDGKTGRLLEPDRDDEAIAAILDLLQKPDLRAAMGRAGRELVRERFDWRTMSATLIGEYQTALEEGKTDAS